MSNIIEANWADREFYGQFQETIQGRDLQDDAYKIFEQREFDDPFFGHFEVATEATAEQREDIFEVWLQCMLGDEEWSFYRDYKDRVLGRGDYSEDEGEDEEEDSRVVLDDETVDFEVLVKMMDDEIREDLHFKLAPCTDQTFVDAYAAAHQAKFGEAFVIN